jgi:hypothetical protein
LIERIDRLAEPRQGFRRLFQGRPGRFGLKIDLMPKSGELRHQRVEIDSRRRVRDGRRVRQFDQPHAKVGENAIDRLQRQRACGRCIARSACKPYRRRGVRHAISSINSSIPSRRPCSNSRCRTRASRSLSLS